MNSELKELPDYLEKDQFLKRKSDDNNAIQIKRGIDICRLVPTIL